MKLIKSKLDQKGFTVAEVLVGIVLFGILMPAIILTVLNLADLNDRASDLNRVNILAENKFEQLRNEGFNSLSDGTYTFTNELDVSITSPRSATYTVSTPETGQKQILIDVSYAEKNQTRTLQYRSLISELGVAQ